jgi:hypothetical protein
MTKAEQREFNLVLAHHAAGLDIHYVARALSAMIRSTRKAATASELRAYAIRSGAAFSPEFIVS